MMLQRFCLSETVSARMNSNRHVAGKSVLQNELIGDLEVEFGGLPDAAEDLPLTELSNAVNADNTPGKTSTQLVARMISTKMPSGFTQKTCSKYLETRWGLGERRRQHVLLEAVLSEPSSRLPSEDAAQAFLDHCCELYASRLVLNLGPASSGSGPESPVALDPEAMNALSKKQNQYLTKQLHVLASHLNVDLSSAAKGRETVLHEASTMNARLDLWRSEFGDRFIDGARPSFSGRKARAYDSWWNWIRIDLTELYHRALLGKLTLANIGQTSQYQRLLNRATPELLRFVQGHILEGTPDVAKGLAYTPVQPFFESLADELRRAASRNPVFRALGSPTAPRTAVDEKGNVSYSEAPRPGAGSMVQYVTNLAGSLLYSSAKMSIGHKKILSLTRPKQLPYLQLKRGQGRGEGDYATAPEHGNGSSDTESEPSIESGSSTTTLNNSSPSSTITTPPGELEDAHIEAVPLIHLKTQSFGAWVYNRPLTLQYFQTLQLAATTGITFKGKCALVTGAGSGSLGSYLVKALIEGGAQVVVTTSRFTPESTKYFKSIYAEHGAQGSKLIVVPFNQASRQDGQSLLDYIYNTLGWDLDMMIPFAALPENGRDLTNIDSTSELAHRMMLTNVLRLMGYIKQIKERRGYDARPTQVLLPLSPNHGIFGGDGLYSESKVALETLANRWFSEGWGEYLSVCNAVIGWTRGTGLMNANDIVAEAIERHGVQTFSQAEMALNLLGLLTHVVSLHCQQQPVFADLSGGLHTVPDLKGLTSQARRELTLTSNLRKALEAERQHEAEMKRDKSSSPMDSQDPNIEPLAELKSNFPSLPEYDTDLLPLHQDLEGMVDLDQVVVVTGFSELGPWGNARTRWEMEAFGTFSLEGAIEMAWIMGFIKHNPSTGNGKTGWVDAKSGAPVPDVQIKAKYAKEILEHSGIRIVEPEMVQGYDPKQKEILQEVAIDDDLEPFEASKETAVSFKEHHGEKADIEPLEDGQWSVRLRKGAVLLIPKAISFDRFVAGQLPTGWNPERYGIPKDIINQVDPITLYTLVCVAEALLSSGITDPYEIYRYIHLSEVGNFIGSGAGGLSSNRAMYRGRYVDSSVQKDILQETFINTTAAWVNMLLMSSAGPLQTPVGACATSVESVELACEAIATGKAKLCVVGGVDDFKEEPSYEFANMKATSSTEDEFAKGRHPSEMSRPTTTTRAGFTEAQGAGIQVLTSAKLALDMGIPIYGVLALASTASDKIGRSVPAPGQGILTTARESQNALPSDFLDTAYRKKQLQAALGHIGEWKKSELARVHQAGKASEDRVSFVEHETQRQQKQAIQLWGNHFWKQNAQISPIRGALAVWGLTIDDIDVASMHGTSTMANDSNESEVICKQLAHLGRRDGHAVLGITQKYLTGHSKGAAAAWQLNGCLQVLNSGIVPGNRNADNVDEHLEAFDRILYSDRTIHTAGIKAFSLTSFGFGQKGAQVIGVHPKYLLATLSRSAYQAYAEKVSARETKANQRLHETLIKNNAFIAKDHAPYQPSEESTIYLDPEARLCADPISKSYSFDARRPHGDIEHAEHALDTGYRSAGSSTPSLAPSSSLLSTPDNEKLDGQEPATPEEALVSDTTAGLLDAMATLEGPGCHIGVGVESIDSLPISQTNFLLRNFTLKERLYAGSGASSEREAYANMWCAKEAASKSLEAQWQGTRPSLQEVEIIHHDSGKLTVSVSFAPSLIRSHLSSVAHSNCG